MKKFVLGLALVLFFAISTVVYAHGPGEGYSMGPWMMNWGHGMGWFWPIIMMAFWIAVIVGIIFLIRWAVLSANKDRGYKPGESALDILKKRYARGEIKKEEFEEKKKDLDG
jgi:putative membrane protein